MNNCQIHSDCKLKYFCIDPTCTVKSKLSCAECQIEGPHKKHDFKNIPVFKNQIGVIAQSCSEYLNKFTNINSGIQSIKEEFEYIRQYVEEILFKMETNLINNMKLDMKNQNVSLDTNENDFNNISEQSQINRLSTLIGDTLKEDNEFLDKYDQSYLFQLYNQKEQMFQNLINTSTSPFKQISQMKVSIINYFQGILSQTQNDKSLNHNQQREPILEVSAFQNKLVKEIELPRKEDNQNNSICARILQNYNENTILITYSDHVIRICDKNTLEILKEFKGHNWSINNVIIIRNSSENQNKIDDNDQIISCSSDTTIKLWNFNDTSIQQNIKSHSHEVNSIVLFNEDSLLSAGKDYMIYFYQICFQNIQNQNQIDKNSFEKSKDLSVKDEQNNEETNEQYGSQIQFNKISEIKQVYELKYLEFPIKQIEKINDIFFAVGYSHGVIGLADFKQRQFLYSFEDKHDLGLYCLARIDESHFCSSGGDRKIKFWNINQTNSITEYQCQLQGFINRIKVNPSSKIVSFSASNAIEFLSYSSLIPSTNKDNPKKNISKPSFAQNKLILKILSLKLNKSSQINDYILSTFTSEEQGLHTRILVGDNSSKLQYFS